MGKILGIVLLVLVIVFAFWETTYSKWVIVIAAIVLLIKMFMHHDAAQVASTPVAKKPVKK